MGCGVAGAKARSMCLSWICPGAGGEGGGLVCLGRPYLGGAEKQGYQLGGEIEQKFLPGWGA